MEWFCHRFDDLTSTSLFAEGVAETVSTLFADNYMTLTKRIDGAAARARCRILHGSVSAAPVAVGIEPASRGDKDERTDDR